MRRRKLVCAQQDGLEMLQRERRGERKEEADERTARRSNKSSMSEIPKIFHVGGGWVGRRRGG